MSSCQLPEWPPSFTPEQTSYLLQLATTYALGHGFTLLPPHTASTGPVPTSSIPAPLSLCPSPFPKDLYDLAVSIQPAYNALYVNVARDIEFLDRVMGGVVSKVDEFQGELWRAWKSCRDELVQPLQLGLFRSDYLLHSSSSDASSPLELKQVEFNTISSSFGALSQLAGDLHRYLSLSTGYFEASPHLTHPDPARFPPNRALASLVQGLADGWKAYGSETARILFVVQEGERNVFDQRWLEWELLEKHGIRVIRQTFKELSVVPSLPTDASHRLLLPDPLSPSFDPIEIAVIYYRAGYTPTDYTSSADWSTRITLERSRAIKCPSLALQLAGAKKVQQVLSEPGMVERYLPAGQGWSTGDIAGLRETFTTLYPMDDSELGTHAQGLARTAPEGYVLKPQREGGGNNIYRADIPGFLDELAREPLAEGEPPKREGYILMSLIEPPLGLRNLLVKGGQAEVKSGEVVSELGVYGVALFDSSEVKVNVGAGTLLRTKGRESDEGGVAVGYSVVDSMVLV